LKALEKKDLVYLHVEAPDEASHIGDLAAKIKSLEDFDRLTIGTLLKG
jgi:2,3-bisphosphoglycerate-independent phosphoglycerate mutase